MVSSGVSCSKRPGKMDFVRVFLTFCHEERPAIPDGRGALSLRLCELSRWVEVLVEPPRLCLELDVHCHKGAE